MQDVRRLAPVPCWMDDGVFVNSPHHRHSERFALLCFALLLLLLFLSSSTTCLPTCLAGCLRVCLTDAYAFSLTHTSLLCCSAIYTTDSLFLSFLLSISLSAARGLRSILRNGAPRFIVVVVVMAASSSSPSSLATCLAYDAHDDDGDGDGPCSMYVDSHQCRAGWMMGCL